jgi:NhaP-type Na+/H+ or K+/H+ antiporter
MTALVLIAVVLIVYSVFAAKLDRWSITAPMVFVGAGTILGLTMGDQLGFVAEPEPVKFVAEITLALLLFADASTLRWSQLKEDGALPVRLLLVAFPLTVLAGFAVAILLEPAAGLAAAALVAAILAPTDAALGLGIFTDPTVPGRVRRALNVESGLNDGLSTPLVTLFLALLVAEEGTGPENWLVESASEIGIALLVAVVVGGASGWLITLAADKSWTSPTPERLAVLAASLLAYTGSVALGGNGFVAAFVAGLVFSVSSRGAVRESVEFTEVLGLFASFVVWAMFGAFLLAPILERGVRWEPIVYAVLSLTLVRMIPVAMAMIGSHVDKPGILFMGWFGPRGLASVVFTLIAFEELDRNNLATEGVVEFAAWTVFLSVLLHGLTAKPLARAYGSTTTQPPTHPSRVEEHAMPRSLVHRDTRAH